MCASLHVAASPSKGVRCCCTLTAAATVNWLRPHTQDVHHRSCRAAVPGSVLLGPVIRERLQGPPGELDWGPDALYPGAAQHAGVSTGAACCSMQRDKSKIAGSSSWAYSCHIAPVAAAAATCMSKTRHVTGA